MLKKGQKAKMTIKIKTENYYMTVHEFNTMNQMIDSGKLSVFRLSICQNCGTEVIRRKKFCSKKCYEKYNNLSEIERLKKILTSKRSRI